MHKEYVHIICRKKIEKEKKNPEIIKNRPLDVWPIDTPSFLAYICKVIKVLVREHPRVKKICSWALSNLMKVEKYTWNNLSCISQFERNLTTFIRNENLENIMRLFLTTSFTHIRDLEIFKEKNLSLKISILKSILKVSLKIKNKCEVF